MAKIELPPRKKVRHLTLLREPRSITPKEFNALAPAERLDMIRAARGKQKYNLILEADDAELLVRSLPAQEIFLLVKELGPEDAADLIPLVETGQFTTFLDLDCWQQDVLDGGAVLPWLQLLLECDEQKVLKTALELEFELLVLMLKKYVTVLHGPEAYEDEDARQQAMEANAGFALDFHDSEAAKIVGAVLDILLRGDRDFYTRLMQAIRFEQEALLEEEVYRFRSGRLLDQGFPDPFEALGVYAHLDPAAFDPGDHRKLPVEPGEEGVEAPAFVLAAARPGDLLAEVLAGGLDSEACWEMTFLVNKVMSANRVDVGDIEQVQTAMDEVYRYLNLGLQHLADDDVERAAELFHGVYLQSLFRLGFSLTLELQRRSREALRSAIGPYLDGPFRAFAEALGRRKPLLFEGIEHPTRGGERPFANRHDLRLAEDWLDRLETQRRLFEERLPFELPSPATLDLTDCVPEEVEDLSLADFLLTALANRILGRSLLPRPLPREELAALHAKVCREGVVDPELRRETLNWLESLEPGAEGFGAWCLDLWEEEFCPLKPDELDPRYLSGMIVKMKD